MASVSSFGAGGSNAHAIVEEYCAPARGASAADGEPVVVPLSARDVERLRAAAANLRAFVRGPTGAVTPLADLGYTLQVGREAMEARLGVVARSLAELDARLTGYLDGAPDHGCFVGPGPGAGSLASALRD